MKLTVAHAVKAAFDSPDSWRATLDNFGQEALALIVDNQYFPEEMKAAAGDTFEVGAVGAGIEALFTALTIEEIFYLHCMSEERHNDLRLSHWESERQTLAMKYIEKRFQEVESLEAQLKLISAMAKLEFPMPSYQSQLLAIAGDTVSWPDGVAPLATALVRLEGCADDDEDELQTVRAWQTLADQVLMPVKVFSHL